MLYTLCKRLQLVVFWGLFTYNSIAYKQRYVWLYVLFNYNPIIFFDE